MVLATISTGLVAGLFYAYACSVMLALRRVGDRTFVEVMRHINTTIQNGWFALSFVGAPLLTLAVVVVDALVGRGIQALVVLAIAADLLWLGVTFRANIPLNTMLERAGRADRLTDPAAVRARFEGPWNRWHLVRTLASVVALAALCGALAWP
jgi:uncharacterized membrane protein